MSMNHTTKPPQESGRSLSCLIIPVIFLSFMSLLIGGIVIQIWVGSRGNISFAPKTPAVGRREILRMSLPLLERWRKQVNIPLATAPYAIAATQEYLVVSNRSNSLLKSNLIVFKADTGRQEWEAKDLEIAYELIADSERVYLADAHRLRAYDLDSGNEIWQSQQIPTHKIFRMSSQLDFIHPKMVKPCSTQRFSGIPGL